MPIEFRQAAGEALRPLTASVPAGAIVGVTGEDSPALRELPRLAAGVIAPASGEIESGTPRRLISVTDSLNFAPVSTLVLDHALATRDELVRARARIGIERLRRGGASILLVSHETGLLEALCDEVWWIQAGQIAMRGGAREVIASYHHDVARSLAEWSRSVAQPLTPAMRRGDGRAVVQSIRTLDAAGRPSAVWRSGEPVAVEVTVKFEQAVADPVIGIMIRTRIGFEVFGTNTELENLKLGPVEAGAVLVVSFAFPCALCAQEYTLTAASHDPDGVWHDWLEDAVAFSVADSRYTAGVANLRAEVSFQHV